MVSVCPLPSSPGRPEEDASWASPCHLASTCLSPTLLSAASSLSRAHALFPSPSPSAGAPSHGDLAPSLCPGAAPGGLEGLVHVRAPVKMNEKKGKTFYLFKIRNTKIYNNINNKNKQIKTPAQVNIEPVTIISSCRHIWCSRNLFWDQDKVCVCRNMGCLCVVLKAFWLCGGGYSRCSGKEEALLCTAL